MIKPLMEHPKVQRIAAPLGLGLIFLLVWQLSFQQLEVPYREARSYRVMHFDLGHIHANEIIVGSILGLDCTESYSVPENLIESILSLNPLKESVMSSFIIY